MTVLELCTIEISGALAEWKSDRPSIPSDLRCPFLWRQRTLPGGSGATQAHTAWHLLARCSGTLVVPGELGGEGACPSRSQ